MLKRTKSFLKQAKKLLKSKKGFFVDTGVKALIVVVLGSLMLGGTYALANDTVMPNVKTKIESMFDYSDGSGSNVGFDDSSLEEKYEFSFHSDVWITPKGAQHPGDVIEVPADKFVTLKVDNKELKKDEYSISGTDTTEIFFNPDYLSSLSLGEHILKAVYDDGYAITDLYIFWDDYEVE